MKTISSWPGCDHQARDDLLDCAPKSGRRLLGACRTGSSVRVGQRRADVRVPLRCGVSVDPAGTPRSDVLIALTCFVGAERLVIWFQRRSSVLHRLLGRLLLRQHLLQLLIESAWRYCGAAAQRDRRRGPRDDLLKRPHRLSACSSSITSGSLSEIRVVRILVAAGLAVRYVYDPRAARPLQEQVGGLVVRFGANAFTP